MDYAVYKKVGDQNETVTKVFTQEKCEHRAKRAARDYIRKLFRRAASHKFIRDIKAEDGNNSFEYDLIKSTTEKVHIRFHVGIYKQK